MKKLTVTLFSIISLTLTACGGNSASSGDPISRGINDVVEETVYYKSCEIVSSKAPTYQSQKQDTHQCWNLPNSMIVKESAESWCSKKSKRYIDDTYDKPHAIKYDVSKDYCIN